MHSRRKSRPQVSTEVPPSAEIKPEDFVYVASTRPDRIGRVMAPVFVNGVGPFAFVVDTGASSSVISPRVVARLKLVPDPARAKLLRGITGSEVVSTVAVESITAGEIMLAKSELPVVEPRVFADADGIFGADAFARGCLYVNFANAHVSILRTACPRVGENWEVMRAKLRFGGLAVVNARVGNIRVIAIIDTGAERSLGNPALLAASGLQALADDPKSRTQVFAATSQAVFGNLVATPSIRLGWRRNRQPARRVRRLRGVPHVGSGRSARHRARHGHPRHDAGVDGRLSARGNCDSCRKARRTPYECASASRPREYRSEPEDHFTRLTRVPIPAFVTSR